MSMPVLSRPSAPSIRTTSSYSVEPLRIDVTGSAGLEGYAKKRRELLEILNSFHGSGIQTEGDLPRVVALGSQSVGKSTLLWLMSGIMLPRNAGTCTRCPTECRLQNSPTWSCQVSIRLHKDAEGNDLPEPREVLFGDLLTDISQVEPVLRRAQAAILNPNVDYRQFVNDSYMNHAPSNGRSLTFSEDCVCIHLKGPDVPDLYFYDLPGVIANVPDGTDVADISFVERLAQKYIAKENCIILLVVSCETDYLNQGAARLIRNDPALRQRTVGVLTKVDKLDEPGDDMISTASHDEVMQGWVDLLKNKIMPLKNGWFAVRQPSQQEIRRASSRGGISRAEALQAERRFFASQGPWNSLSPRYQQRLGSSQLSENLSTILSNLVEQQLPTIQLGISRSLHEVKHELRQMPHRHTEDHRGEVIKILCDFAKKISDHIEGVPPSYDQTQASLMFAINSTFEEFKLDVHRTVPRFRPWKVISTGQLPNETLDHMIQTASADDPADGRGTIMHVDQVMDLARRSRTRELPGIYPYSVRETLIKEFTSNWEKLMNDCFETVEDILNTHVNMILRDHFAYYTHGGLLDQVNSIIQQQTFKCVVAAKKRLDAQYDMEREHYTQNEAFYFDCRDKFVTRYRSLFRESLQQNTVFDKLLECSKMGESLMLQTPFGAKVHAVLAGLEELGITSRQPTELGKLLPNDNLDPALEIMAEVRAYFQVAYKRFADVVPQIIDDKFVRAFGSSLEVALHLMDVSSEACIKFLEEAPEIRRRRHDLTQKKTRLEEAKDRLEKLFVSADSVGYPVSPSLSSFNDVSSSDFASPTLTEAPLPL
ncbi:hypothetical protein SERLA73DRAFT_162866 [Serpula lacrymans var. lacrymans S7.3]|uniref:GED domain-containing protein n=2 Tax=Serpula lacrymans var. lacrymans TaxID=341189 RepID=F8QAM1_SERL3|nr:uncharacterized protein SERLADRAFT_418022 [Serpula lacrymans var. lacrymans S7.9]EGN94811.1 hypothetical protein SERLA73DRAFT_162866 [Serpula lacrymans var. lacrymans S7.3]EGO20310.1 hypothetical protein SERLADRAFT_418022 [Serpula lacrymans var. lacrymans S7.9]